MSSYNQCLYKKLLTTSIILRFVRCSDYYLPNLFCIAHFSNSVLFYGYFSIIKHKQINYYDERSNNFFNSLHVKCNAFDFKHVYTL